MEEQKQTKLTLSTEYGEYSICLNKIDMDIYDIFGNMIIPVLISAGYSENSINDGLKEFCDTE